MADDDDDVVLEWDAPGAAEMMGAVPVATPVATPAPRPSAVAIRRLDIGAATSPGRVRPHNEDSFLVEQFSWCNLDQRRDLALIVVADGVGGYQAGDQASNLVIRTIGGALNPLLTGILTGQTGALTVAQMGQNIDNALRGANRVVFQRAQGNAACKGMAATAVVLAILDGQVAIGHVGDCRVYHFRAGQLTQVTRDQTLVARMVELGQLSPQEALRHPSRNEVTQAVGRHSEITPAAYQLALATGDWLVIACDGLHAHVEHAQLAQVLHQAGPTAALTANYLVGLANQGGGTDNITVVAVRCY